MIRPCLVLVLSVFLFSDLSAQRVAHVNFGNLLSRLPETEQADEVLETMNDSLSKVGQAMIDKFEAEIADLEANMDELPPIKVRELQTKLQQDQRNIQQFSVDIQRKVEARRRQLLGPIVQRAKDAIARIAKEQGYDIVIDSSIFSAVLYADDIMGLTDEVAAALGIEDLEDDQE